MVSSYELTDNTVLLDQGGGSTEISVFTKNGHKLAFVDNQGSYQSTNIPVGTTNAVNNCLNNTQYDTSMQTALENNDASHRTEINKGTLPIRGLEVSRLIGVGTAITKATNKPSNKKCTVLSEKDLEQQQRTRSKLDV